MATIPVEGAGSGDGVAEPAVAAFKAVSRRIFQPVHISNWKSSTGKYFAPPSLYHHRIHMTSVSVPCVALPCVPCVPFVRYVRAVMAPYRLAVVVPHGCHWKME